jgi:hypothetical protein
MPVPPDERRTHLMRERFHTREIAALEVTLRVGDDTLECVTGNINERGMLVETARTWPIGTEVVVGVRYYEHRVVGPATVASHAPEGLGLQYLEPTVDFRTGIENIILCLRDERRGATHDHVSVQAAWSYPVGGSSLRRLLSRRYAANLISLTANGAALVSRKSPRVGETVVVFLDPDDEQLRCTAEVARHTDRGFAVRFAAPGEVFLARIAQLRHS